MKFIIVIIDAKMEIEKGYRVYRGSSINPATLCFREKFHTRHKHLFIYNYTFLNLFFFHVCFIIFILLKIQKRERRYKVFLSSSQSITLELQILVSKFHVYYQTDVHERITCATKTTRSTHVYVILSLLNLNLFAFCQDVSIILFLFYESVIKCGEEMSPSNKKMHFMRRDKKIYIIKERTN